MTQQRVKPHTLGFIMSAPAACRTFTPSGLCCLTATATGVMTAPAQQAAHRYVCSSGVTETIQRPYLAAPS